MTTTLKVSIGSYSDKGPKSENEDFFGAIIPQEPQLTLKGIAIAIADGMSGSDAGKQASQTCVGSFLNDYYSTPDSWTVTHSGQKILSATNLWLYSQGKTLHASVKGMVTTLSTIILKSNTAYLFHVGDSRIYRLRKNNFEQMTQDHRVWISKDKNYLSRAVGIEPHLEVDYKSFPLEKGDRFIMTTDGVHDFIDEKVLRQCAANGNELDNIAESIVKQALNNSDDNLTCQVVQIDELPQLKEDEIMRRYANLPFPPALEEGMVLDGYQVQAELHASKRTQIYQAYDTLHHCNVILKTPSVLYDDDTHYIEQFLHEEWAAKRIQHENVLKVAETDRNKTCVYYVTEFIAGQTLREWIQHNSKPDLAIARSIIEQIAKGLRAFHSKEMLHQDLKPENIMIASDGTVKIIDFGSVKIAGIAEITPLEHGAEENVLGTLNYTAPEYHLGQRGNNKSDLYSLGVIAYEMLNGSLPFGGDMPEKPNRINLSRLEYVPSIRNNAMVPIWIDGALRKATSISPQLRYDELSEFIFDLKTPNPKFMQVEDRLPLMQRNPVSFWRSVAGLLLLLNFVLVYMLSR